MGIIRHLEEAANYSARWINSVIHNALKENRRQHSASSPRIRCHIEAERITTVVNCELKKIGPRIG